METTMDNRKTCLSIIHETTNRPSRPDRLGIFWNDWGERDDPEDHISGKQA